jgi:putative peptidoglycan lipid II flippase
LTLYTLLQARGWFRLTARLASRIARQLAATAVMAAFLWWLTPRLSDRYDGTAFERIWSLGVLVTGGMLVFFAAAFLLGALDKDLLAQLRRRPAKPVDLAE